MILPIYTYGQPALRKQTEDITLEYEGLNELIDNMFETMYNASGVGLAAPQVGLSIRLFVIDADVLSDDYPECKGMKKAYINPRIVDHSEEVVTMEEGCLSLPGINENVARPIWVDVTYTDVEGNVHQERLDGWAARVFQHEYDHLEGHVFTDRISPIRRQFVKTKLMNISKGKTPCRYKVKR